MKATQLRTTDEIIKRLRKHARQNGCSPALLFPDLWKGAYQRELHQLLIAGLVLACEHDLEQLRATVDALQAQRSLVFKQLDAAAPDIFQGGDAATLPGIAAVRRALLGEAVKPPVVSVVVELGPEALGTRIPEFADLERLFRQLQQQVARERRQALLGFEQLPTGKGRVQWR